MEKIPQFPTPLEPANWIGKTINGRYLIAEQLGQGGMGTVYLAHDSILDREVALKVITSVRLGAESRSRLLTEARTVAKLAHPNIVIVFDAGEVDHQAYVVMEYIQGKTLGETSIDGFKAIVDIAKQICTALQYAHDQGIIHRDLKPENVIIQPDGVLRLMDFGLAISTTSRLTDSGLIMGTVAYMSPEQAFGYQLTPASDLYSLGVMLYELTTRKLPFEAEDALAVITQHIHAPAVPPRAINELIPSNLNALILSLMEKDPLARPGSAGEVLELLAQHDFLAQERPVEQDFTVLDRIVRGRMIGRQAELEEAKLLWRRVIAGQGQVLLISGEPGIGKTRMMREVITNAEVTGGTSLLGECYAETSTPYGAFSQITRQALNTLSKDGLDIPEAVLDDLLSLTPDLRYRFPHIQLNPKLDPESEQQRLFENMVFLYSMLARKSPLLLVVDDAHWADSGSVAMLHHLVRRTHNLPVMILATYREVELKGSRPFNEMLIDLNRQRLGYRIKLDRLDREATGELLKAIFAEEISNEFLDGIYRETNGNPFFIEEICRALIDTGAVYFEDRAWQRLDMQELEIPQGVQVAVESRLIKLPKEHQDVLRMASIIGREFSFDVLSAALDLDEDIIIDGLEAAESAQMIEEINGFGDVTFRFVHALVPNAIADSVRTLRRRKLHRRVANAVAAINPQDYENLAYHFSEAGEDSQAIKYYSLAGERAAEAYTNQDAEKYLQSALDLVEDDRQRASLLARLGLAQAHQNKYQAALETWHTAIEIYSSLDELDQVAELFARSIRTTWDNGETKASLALAQNSLSTLQGASEGPGLANLLAEYSRACYFNGLVDESKEFGQRSLEMAEKLHLTDIQVDSLTTLGTIAWNSKDLSAQLLEKAAQMADTANLPRRATRAHNNLAILYLRQFSDYNRAMDHMQQAAQIAHQIGDRDGELFFRSNLGMWMLLKGRIREIEDMLPELEELKESLPDVGAGNLGFEQLYNTWLACRGEFNQALEFAQSSRGKVRQLGDLQRLESILVIITLVSIITGDFDPANSAAEELVQLAEKEAASKAQAFGISSIIFSRIGELTLARTRYQQASENFENPEKGVFDRQYIYWAEAELFLAEHKWGQAWEVFEYLHAFLEHEDFPWHANLYLTMWGFALLEHGTLHQKARAKRLLTEACENFQAMGAEGFVDLIASRLVDDA